MDSTVLTVRAITAVFGRRLLWPVLIVLLAVYGIVFGLSWWLAAVVHPLWWLLVVMLTPICIVAGALWIVCFLLLRRIHPPLTTHQKRLTNELVDHVAHIAEELGTPRFIILGRVLRDAVFGSSLRNSYIGQMTREPGEAHRKFEALRRSF